MSSDHSGSVVNIFPNVPIPIHVMDRGSDSSGVPHTAKGPNFTKATAKYHSVGKKPITKIINIPSANGNEEDWSKFKQNISKIFEKDGLKAEFDVLWEKRYNDFVTLTQCGDLEYVFDDDNSPTFLIKENSRYAESFLEEVYKSDKFDEQFLELIKDGKRNLTGLEHLHQVYRTNTPIRAGFENKSMGKKAESDNELEKFLDPKPNKKRVDTADVQDTPTDNTKDKRQTFGSLGGWFANKFSRQSSNIVAPAITDAEKEKVPKKK